MLNHTYTSVKNANLVDCGKKQHIPSQPTPLLKENFLGEFRTELDKKKVLAALGIATELSLEWGNIKGNIGDSTQLMNELDLRTKYTSALDGMSKTIGAGIAYLESIVGGEEAVEEEQNERITELEKSFVTLQTNITNVQKYLTDTVDVNITQLQKGLEDISKSVENITSLIQVSAQVDNALSLLEGENPGLYVPDLSGRVESAESDIDTLQANVATIEKDFVKRSEFGDGNLDFVSKSTYDSFSTNTSNRLDALESEIENTVKTGEDGHVATLYVNKISKDNDSGNIQVTDSFEMESGIPLDVRAVVEDLDELKSLPVKVCYPGMGVIVNSLSALYILRKPDKPQDFTQEYIANIYNWKCPEDLVTQAMTRDEYDSLTEINPNVFYYIYEEPVTYTQEPVRNQDETDEEWTERWNDWIRSLKILSQEYMSAAWGVDIEKKLGQKASSADLNALNSNLTQVRDELADLKGGDADNSLVSLGKSIKDIQDAASELEGRLDKLVDVNEDGKEVGRIVELEDSVEAVASSLGDYVTKNELQDETQDFIFVKTSDYEDYKAKLEASITTEQITTTSLSLNSANIEVAEDRLKIEGKPIALSEDLMQVEVIDQDTYNQKEQAGELSNNVYYYTYDGNVSLVTNDDLNSVKKDLKDLQSVVGKLQQDLAALQQIVQESNPTI